MHGYKSNIEKLTLANNNFRKVLYTGKHSQLVLMSLKPGEEIGEEVHKENDQFFRVEQGSGKVIINKKSFTIKDGDVVIVPAGAKHNVLNSSKTESLKLYTLYSPPHHKDKVVHKTKQQAEADTKDYFKGKTTE